MPHHSRQKHWLNGLSKQFEMAAKTMGAEPVGILFTGMISMQKHKPLSDKAADRARVIAARLLTA
jgi:hypothetical protein